MYTQDNLYSAQKFNSLSIYSINKIFNRWCNAVTYIYIGFLGGDFMPVSTAPYTRKYAHTKARGKERQVVCGYCGRLVPRYKTFTKIKGFRITDPTVLQQVDRRQMHMFRQKVYACPSCARFRGIVERGKSIRKKHMIR